MPPISPLLAGSHPQLLHASGPHTAWSCRLFPRSSLPSSYVRLISCCPLDWATVAQTFDQQNSESIWEDVSECVTSASVNWVKRPSFPRAGGPPPIRWRSGRNKKAERGGQSHTLGPRVKHQPFQGLELQLLAWNLRHQLLGAPAGQWQTGTSRPV